MAGGNAPHSNTFIYNTTMHWFAEYELRLLLSCSHQRKQHEHNTLEKEFIEIKQSQLIINFYEVDGRFRILYVFKRQ